MEHLNQDQNFFDILIIGGGHAGIEAAHIATQFNLRVGLLSMPEVPLASTPCNPAIGGVGKGQVVREIDALGGLMGKIADASGIQFRILNESKGFAVQSTRVQVDKDLYSQCATELIARNLLISVVRIKVDKIQKIGDNFIAEGSDGRSYGGKKLILTTGTFLNGRTHCGETVETGGRVDKPSSSALGNLFAEVSVATHRFKTGTPPRLKNSSLDYTQFVVQATDPAAFNFHSLNAPNQRQQKQLDCFLAETSPKMMQEIRKNKERSPIYNGQIAGVGPRYCPSIEDKAFRYPDKDVHHVFVEPEGHNRQTMYPNGLSTSLPLEVQQKFLREMPGFETAEIMVPGYAVEYDVINTTELNLQLEHQNVTGLYFAGQVNGTSGYEEAAGQGIIAGINAALSLLKRAPLILSRNDSYIGVMIEDLVTDLRDEPYRLFTARAENRLFMREDNTINRISGYRKSLELKTELDDYQERYSKQFKWLSELCREVTIKANPANRKYFKEMAYGELTSNIFLEELLKRAHLNPIETLNNECLARGLSFDPLIVKGVAISLKYDGYIKRAEVQGRKMLKLGQKAVLWDQLQGNKNISFECRQRIAEIRPETFSQLQRIVGIRPATLAYVAGNLV
ncbi:MAG: tRNA uridine-5-carboxymethylaminomethyl(34) synthesis enzyme MnmG [Halobacteriovoraceae bacterium]|nr:tRNA uridine-5-carboxymethylaminomethyl(34) synthesis enzyme MnmG [Halobacteriovoraceae bacterium]